MELHCCSGVLGEDARRVEGWEDTCLPLVVGSFFIMRSDMDIRNANLVL